jgi:peptide/nickel transport system substrate-binding protein
VPKLFQNLIRYGRQARRGLPFLPAIRLSTIRKVFSLMGKRERIAAVALVGIAAVSASVSLNRFYLNHTQPVPTAGGSYNEGIIGQPRLVNPLLATSDTDTALVRLVFSGLYKYDGQGQLVPDLADGMPQISEDQKHYTVRLRHDVKWHNDKAFTADDVVFTIKTLQDPAYNSPLRLEWLNTTVSKTDDYTVAFQVKDISGPFISNLVLPILSKNTWQNVNPKDFILSQNNLEATGTGPYFIKEIKKLPQGTVQSIQLEADSNYYGGRPNLDSVRLVFYEDYNDVLQGLHGKQITGFGFIPSDQNFYLDANNKSLTIRRLPLPQYQATFFNLSNKIFSDKNVRQAFVLATDKQQIINEVYGGNALPINGPILPEQVSGVPPADTRVDLDAAKKQLDAAGWKIDPQTNIRAKGGVKLEFTLATNDFALNARTAELLAGQWGQLNAKVSLNILPTKDLTDTVIRPRKFDVLLFSQKLGPDPDPFVFWHSSQSKNPGFNLTGFSNAAADQLISQARTSTKAEIRDEKYRQFQNLIIQEVPAIFLNQSVYIYALDHNLKGVTLKNLYDQVDRFYDIRNWYLDERRVWK